MLTQLPVIIMSLIHQRACPCPTDFAGCAALLQGYILLLLRSDASLLGLKYLTILIYTFLNPPIRHRYEETDHAGRTVDAPHSAAARIYAGRFISIGSCLPDMSFKTSHGAR